MGAKEPIRPENSFTEQAHRCKILDEIDFDECLCAKVDKKLYVSIKLSQPLLNKQLLSARGFHS